MKLIDEDHIRTLLQAELAEKVEIKKTTDLKSLDLDSLSFISIGSEIEDAYDIKLIRNMQQIELMKKNINTFGDFIEFLNNQINEQARS
jgi:acyl carrier protein